jgi:hypothetical protein
MNYLGYLLREVALSISRVNRWRRRAALVEIARSSREVQARWGLAYQEFNMTLADLAKSLNAYERVDVSAFQRRARVLQVLWRQEQDLDPAERGSRLAAPAAEALKNFLTETVRDVVRTEVMDPLTSAGSSTPGRASSMTFFQVSHFASTSSASLRAISTSHRRSSRI